jgi:hypothetical protein
MFQNNWLNKKLFNVNRNIIRDEDGVYKDPFEYVFKEELIVIPSINFDGYDHNQVVN